jgi:hypothetical protein
MLRSVCFITFGAFSWKLVAANRALVLFCNLSSRARGLLVRYSSRWHCRERRTWEHVDNRLRARAEVEWELTVVWSGVARGGRVGFKRPERSRLGITGRQRWQPALSRGCATVIADSATVARRIASALSLSIADVSQRVLHVRRRTMSARVCWLARRKVWSRRSRQLAWRSSRCAWNILWRRSIVGIGNTWIANAHLFASAQRWVAERCKGRHVAVVIASQVDEVQAVVGWMDNELSRDGDTMRRAGRAHHPPTLPTVVLPMQKREVPPTNRTLRDVCVWLPGRESNVAHSSRRRRAMWQRVRRRRWGRQWRRSWPRDWRGAQDYGVGRRRAWVAGVHSDARGSAHGRLGCRQAPLAVGAERRVGVGARGRAVRESIS